MLNKEEELGCFEILKHNFPKLQNKSLVIGLYEFLSPDVNLENFICRDQTAKQAAVPYIKAQKPYIVLDETEGYKCLFFRGRIIRAHYDVSNSKMLQYNEDALE